MYRPSDNAAGDMPDGPLFDKLTERDLRRIATNRALCPPPADPDDPHWTEAWAHFEVIYGPALRRYVYNVLCRAGLHATALHDADEIVGEFVCKRLRDGRLNPSGGRIERFRHWLACQARRFTIDWLRSRSTQRSYPEHGFASSALLDTLESHAANAAALESLTEQLVADIARIVLERIAKRSEPQAQVLRDLIWNEGRQSPDIAELIRVEPHRVRDIRRRARERFRLELVDLVRTGPFAEGDIEDLIQALGRTIGHTHAVQPAAESPATT